MLHVLTRFFLLCCVLLSGGAQAMQLTATRMWPSPDYTRITLEAAQPLAHNFFTLTAPDRLVIDLEGVGAGPALDALARQLSADDPFVSGIRAGLNRPGVMRVVVDLRQPVKPSIFQLPPAGQYGHRLVVDLYPADAGGNV
ncbi:MAG: AMIN domain-containing protein, partial [Planctomycetota bacterium]